VFTNQTTGDTPITYQWDFGDSSAINTTENPTHTYGAADTYTVVLTATNAFGSDSVMHQVVVGEPPAADFTSNSPQATGAPVQYTNGTTGDGTLSYAWNFGDGSGISTAVNPTHAYSAAATYTVILTATSEFGTDAISHPVEIGDPPAADFTSNSPVTVGTQAVFTNTTTGSDAISYEWDFGDGSSSTAENPVHDYVAPDIYTVVMTATSVFGIDATSHSFVVNEDTSGAPVAGFIFEGSGRVGDPIQFTSTSTGQAPLNHEWDFGDGNSSMEANPTHIYTGAGDYIVTLTVTNDIDSDETTDTVNIRYYLFVPLVIADDL
jgi:PKD repeat protein